MSEDRPDRDDSAELRPHVAEICGQVVSVDHLDTSLDQILRTRRLTVSERLDRTVRVEPVFESLLRPPFPRANRGLLQLLPLIAGRGGPSFRQLTSVSTRSLPPPERFAGNFPQILSPHVAEFVHEHPLGLIQCGPSVSRSHLIGEIALAFPSQSLAVMTASRADVGSIQQDLRRMGIRSQRLVTAREPDRAERIVIGTFSSMAHAEVELEKRDILIIFNARDAISNRAQGPLTAPDLRGRLYAFQQGDGKFSPLEEDRLAATFGFQRVDVPAPGFEAVDINMQWTPFFVARPNGRTAMEIKRHGIWRCEPRNRIIARLATRAREQHHRVVILTETLEHAARLARKLPDWPICFERDCDLSGLAGQDAMRLQAARSRWIMGTELITTAAGLATIRPGVFNLLIWAGSGPGLPPIPASHLASLSGTRGQLTIVDIRDRHHPLLRRWSRSREDAYARLGWFERPFNISSAICRANNFLERLQGRNS